MQIPCMTEFLNDLNAKKYLTYQMLFQTEKADEICIFADHLSTKNPRQILWHIINQVADVPKCAVCENLAKWHIDKRNYRLFCGGSCASKWVAKEYSKKCIHSFGVSHHSKVKGWSDKVKATCQIKYGVDHPSQLEKVKENRKQTCIKKYGGSAPSSSAFVRQKMEQTNLQKYGVKVATELETIRKKRETTNIKKYGVPFALQSQSFRDKLRKTNFDRYKRFSHMQQQFSDYCFTIISDQKNLESFLKNKSILLAAKELGIGYSSLYQIITKFNLKIVNNGLGSSSLQNEIFSWFKNQNIDVVKSSRKIITPYEIDLYLPCFKMAIEVNGDYWHMNPKFYMETDFHKTTGKLAKDIWARDQLKFEMCKQKNINLVTIWESDWIENSQDIKTYFEDYFKCGAK